MDFTDKLTREILIEKYQKPGFIEKDPGRTLYHWYNEKGFAHRDNNLPAVVIIMYDTTILHYHRNGYQYKTVCLDKDGNNVPSHIKTPGGWLMTADWCEDKTPTNNRSGFISLESILKL